MSIAASKGGLLLHDGGSALFQCLHPSRWSPFITVLGPPESCPHKPSVPLITNFPDSLARTLSCFQKQQPVAEKSLLGAPRGAVGTRPGYCSSTRGLCSPHVLTKLEEESGQTQNHKRPAPTITRRPAPYVDQHHKEASNQNHKEASTTTLFLGPPLWSYICWPRSGGLGGLGPLGARLVSFLIQASAAGNSSSLRLAELGAAL